MNYIETYEPLSGVSTSAPPYWADSCTNHECSLHQLSPYIGKLKSVIARDLILQYTTPGDLVADMFCGSGTVPLEAAILGRRVFASDTSKYAIVLTKGKLYAPEDVDTALDTLHFLLAYAESSPFPDLRRVPKWVRSFFHPSTLKEVLRLTEVLKKKKQYFFLASLLGILHHQRPGFLSYPSSHLVPYLRTRNFPKSDYPDLYKYRSVTPRLKAKIHRALKRNSKLPLTTLVNGIRRASAISVNLPSEIDCVITSPPYMNALDYGRDNRLRLWFLDELCNNTTDGVLKILPEFQKLLDILVNQLSEKIKPGGYCIFVVGEQTFRGTDHFPSDVLMRSLMRHKSTFSLHDLIKDTIPDIRRSRKHLSGVKREHVLIFRKN